MLKKIIEDRSKDIYLKYYRQEIARIKRENYKALNMVYYLDNNNELKYFIPDRELAN